MRYRVTLRSTPTPPLNPISFEEMLKKPGVYRSIRLKEDCDKNHRIISFNGQAIDNILRDWTRLGKGRGEEFVRVPDEWATVEVIEQYTTE